MPACVQLGEAIDAPGLGAMTEGFRAGRCAFDPRVGVRPLRCRHARQQDFGRQRVGVARSVRARRHRMALGARDPSAEGAAAQVSLMSADADGRSIEIAEGVDRRRRIVAAAVACRAAPAFDLHVAVDVKRGRDDPPLGVDDRGVARRAQFSDCGCGAGGGKSVAAPAGALRVARLGPHRVGLAMAVAVAAAPRHDVVAAAAARR